MPTTPAVPVVMLALLGTHLAGMGAFLAVPVLATVIAAETGLPASLTGLHTALVYAGAMLSGPLTGELLRRWGGIRLLQLGLLTVAGALLLATLGSPLALALSALLAGLGHGPVTPAGSHLLAAHTPPHRRSLIFSLKQCGVPAGAMLVAAVVPAVGAAAGWRAGILVAAGVAALTALAIQPLREALDADRDRNRRGGAVRAGFRAVTGSLGLLRRDGNLRALTFASALFGVSQFCFFTFFVVWQVEALGTPLAEAGLRLALAQAAGIAGRILWGLAADHAGARPVLITVGLGAAAAGAALALAGPGWPGIAVLGAGLAMGFTAVGWNGALLAETARLAPAGQVGTATAALGFVFAACMLVAPPAFSVLVGLTGGYQAGFALCAATALLGSLALRPLGRAPR
jgi:MFS family permease